MDPQTLAKLKLFASQVLAGLSIAFDKTATWVGKLSWWKFFLFAILLFISGDIIQDALSPNESTTSQHKSTSKKRAQKEDSAKRTIKTDDANFEIDNTGIRIKKPEHMASGKRVEINGDGWEVVDEQAEKIKEKIEGAVDESKKKEANSNSLPGITIGKDDVHIRLPKELAKEIQAELDKAKADAAEEATTEEKTKSSKWFKNFIALLVFGLFGMKALMGGKVRAEEQAKVANAAAEREALLRQVSEAQMQMMQAQVEPHFLFNTLASVEYLIETDPPRAAAMQRSLISYLRAVLPQMRENAAKTNLGREADIVKSYLQLIKMRMEERLNIDFIMPENLRSASFPPMMLQSVVENAIKHGLEVKAEGGTLQFRAEILGEKLRVTVKDDGLGFGAVPSNGTGLGLQNIKERLKLIYKDNAQLIITANQPSGVCVAIEIPFEIAK
ncbi:histidine kinase [Undibacterium sp. LX40W]|uniref:Histidine kinase n=1 Tax=Undibacterium nitidum TaxID=2762298 RepID=A0A923KVK1_9BURK|nr:MULTISPECIES: histidine kinase [Undibacterium]MBC3883232.1 histidine kinase [Undibacterium nitidum]MBC3893514.1 histidine kinase [Undibacterium sp. LX40W]